MKYSALLISACFSAALAPHASETSSSAQIGQQVSSTLIQKLGGQLKAQMAENGPVAALGFCSASAQSLTKEVSDSTHYPVKRVSLKNRSPLNQPSPRETSILTTWENDIKNGRKLPEYIIESDSGIDHFYKPLLINNEACLKCHGSLDNESPLAKAIKAAYPHDRATGYKMGDLRGMILVDIPVTR